MPVSNTVASGYLQLGIAGAALLIVLINQFLNARQSGKIINSSNDKVDKLCDKIDSLVTTISTDMVSNDKDSKDIKNKLDMLLNVAIENQRRISRIDDRTYQCLGNPKKEVKEVTQNT